MKIKLSSAINRFFPNSSFKMIYSEAMANALDANATLLHIDISIQAFNKPDTLIIKIKDNGVGFSDENFQRFSHLMDTKDNSHKGLGRLVFLKYFSSVKFASIFKDDKQQFVERTFLFNDVFNDKKEDKIIDDVNSTGANLVFQDFRNKAVYAHSYIKPNEIITYLTNCFLPRLYAMKQSGSAFTLKVSLSVEDETTIGEDFKSGECHFSLDKLPELQEKIINNQELDFFKSEFNLLYYIDKNNSCSMVNNITALCIDDRAIELDVLDKQALPKTHQFIFLLKSEYLNQKIDNARQDVTLNEQELKVLKRIFLEQISEIISEKIPEIEEKNNQTIQTLSIKFPHLEGLFPKNSIGFLNEYQSVEFAQDKLFEEQKEILMAETLSNEMYEKSLVQASRVLAEYILYRNKIIQKLKSIEANDKEKKIHNLIVPMQKTLRAENHFENRFINNAWLLDDKYMSYKTVLSDENIEELIKEITDDQEIPSDLRPDIAFVFSDDINTCDHPVDVVVVELKKKNLDYLKNSEVISQMEQRARRLLAYYPEKIQRMWFFGIVEIDAELRLLLEEKWIPLYSKGDVFYKEERLFPMNKNKEKIGTNTLPVKMMIMSFDALWKDAEARNNSFLDIFRKAIQDYTKQND
ncbi:MAG: ATP-binding protein [Neisseriaceae bacterium]|nr:ATP-binding protein [Neisseriaceae bacterium]